MDVCLNRKVFLQIDFLEFQIDGGWLKVEVGKMFDFVFYENVEFVGEGVVLFVNGIVYLFVEVYGIVEMSEVKFWGKLMLGQKFLIRGVKFDDVFFVLSMLGKVEVWVFNIKGFKEIIMEIVSIIGGIFLIKGIVVL